MVHFSSVGCLVFAVCLVAFGSASAAEGGVQEKVNEITQTVAKQAVNEAQKSINQLSKKATNNRSSANGVLEKVKSSKKKSDKAEGEADQAAKDNTKAKTIFETIKTISKRVTELHESVKGKLLNSITNLDNVVAEAEQLKVQLNSVLPLTEAASKDYSDAKTKALGIKQQADNLDTNISEALVIINGVSATVEQIEKGAEDAELKKLQVSGIVAGTELETTIGEADSIIQTINNKKEEVNGIFQEMEKRSTNAPTGLIESINGLLQRVDIELRHATGAFDNATKVKTQMMQQKETADDALTKVEKATDVSNAQQEVATVKGCVGKVKDLVPLVKTALQTANRSATNANVLKKQMETSLSKAISEQNDREVRETEKSDIPVGDGTGTDQKDAMKQTTITNTEQPTTTDSIGQGNNSADKLKDTLIKDAQTVPTTALTGGKAPAPGAKNDSAMTVSVPLLVALIASAVLR